MDDYYSVKQFAEKLGITAQGVHALMKAGTIQFKRVGFGFCIHKDELEKAKARKGRGRPRGT